MSDVITITPVALPIEQTATLAVRIDDSCWREFWMQRRRALLSEIDAIEKALCVHPTTAQIRQRYRMLDKAP